MRILHVNKFAYPKGGAEHYMYRLAERQLAEGHGVGVFGAPDTGDMIHSSDSPKRLGDESATDLQTYHVDVYDYHKLQTWRKPIAGVDTVWSRKARVALRKAIEDFKPSVVHLHNYAHQLTSSIIHELRGLQIRPVQTAHDYKLICPSYVASIDHADCFACSQNISLKAIRLRCHHGSLPWTAVASLESKVTRSMRLCPPEIVAPSAYMEKRIKSSWADPYVNTSLIRNPVTAGGQTWQGDGDYLLYIGRLSREKGVAELVRACRSIGIPLRIAGSGPEEPRLRELASDDPGITFLGHTSQADLDPLRVHCMAQVVPSTWPENAPLAALEAAAIGAPIVAAHRGGLPELSSLGAKIATYEGTNITAKLLSTAIASLQDLSGDLDRFRAECSWEVHLTKLHKLYAKVAEG